MKLISIGSANIDKVFLVDHFPVSGEAMHTEALNTYVGGKGVNQAIAIGKAGSKVVYGGKIGGDGGIIRNALEIAPNVDTSKLIVDEDAYSGVATVMVQVSTAENCSLLYAGTNYQITDEEIDWMLEDFGNGDGLILQNEISGTAHILEVAHKKGIISFMTPCPLRPFLRTMPEMAYVDWLFLNQVEGAYLVEEEGTPEELCEALVRKYPNTKIMLTLGTDGSICYDGKEYIRQHSYHVPEVDSTGAGDTFCGFCISRIMSGDSIQQAMDTASRAAAICVSRAGAAPSIPTLEEVRGWQFED